MFFYFKLKVQLNFRDIDSDGEEMPTIDVDERPLNFTLWFSLNIKVNPPPPQTVVIIEANCLVSIYLK